MDMKFGAFLSVNLRNLYIDMLENGICASVLHSSNMAVLGDCGRFPLWIEAARRCTKYWLRKMSMDDLRYVRKYYNMLKFLDDYGYTTWVSNV